MPKFAFLFCSCPQCRGSGRGAALDNVLNPGREGQSWILLWDMASIHAREATLAAMWATFPHVVLASLPPRSTSHLQPCDVAVFRSFKSCIQAQASATLARCVLDGSFDGLAMSKAWRRQSSAEWASRAVTDLCEKNQAWTTGWHSLRAGSNAEFRCRDGGRGTPFSRRALLQPHRAGARSRRPCGLGHGRGTSVRLRGRRAHARRAASSGVCTSDVELGTVHRSAPRVRRWTGLSRNKNAQPSSYHIVPLLSQLCRVSCLSVVVSVGVLPRLPD